MLTEDMRNIVDNARETGWILEPDAKRLLSLAGLMVPDFTLAATAQEAEGGAYYGPDGIWELHGHPARADIAAQARDTAAAARLWSVSEALTGVDCTV